jgi:hypothetical protein
MNTLDKLLELGIAEEVEDRYSKYILKNELLEFLRLKDRECLLKILKQLRVYGELKEYYDIDTNYTKEDLEYFINDLFNTIEKREDQYANRHSQTVLVFFLNLTKKYKGKELGAIFNRSATWSRSLGKFDRVILNRFIRASEQKKIEYKGRCAFLRGIEEKDIAFKKQQEEFISKEIKEKEDFIKSFLEKYERYPNDIELIERTVSRIFYGDCPNCGRLADSYITKHNTFKARCNACEAILELKTDDI